MAAYREPVLEKLIEELNATGPAKLKNRYYVGDPVIVATSDMPVCFISKDTTTIGIDTNVEDVHEMPIVLNVVFSGSKDINSKFAQGGALGLYELCEGRDENYRLRSDCVAAVLRQQVLDGNNKLYVDIEGSNTTIEYILSPPQRRGMFSVEAIVRTTLRQYQIHP